MNPAKSPSSGKKAINYAEYDLGVHRVYGEARAARAALDKTLTELSEARDKKRDLELRLQDQEMEIIADERGKHPDMSAAAMEKHLKVAYNQSDTVREFREQVMSVVNDIEGLEYDRTIHEVDIRIATSRLQELGGYFHYLAAIKEAATAQATKKQETTT
jgi:hypothetical protein